MSCKIVIPSMGRAENVLTTKLVDAIICVPEKEKEKYLHYNRDVEIITHPDSVIGLPAKRQWMLDYFNELFMLDDDIAYVQNISRNHGEKGFIKDKNEIYEIIQNLYFLAKLLEVSLFGFSSKTNPLQFNEFKPFTLNGKITGCSYGAIKSRNVKWNADLKVKEDFWVSSYVMYHERRILVDNRYRFQQKETFKNPGGLSSQRNTKTEMEAILEMRKYFGESILLKSQIKTVDSSVKYNIFTKYLI